MKKKNKHLIYNYPSRDDVLKKQIVEVLDYLYRHSYPVNTKGIINLTKEIDKDSTKNYTWPIDFFYMPERAQKEIWESYKHAFGIEFYWEDDIKAIEGFLFDGGGLHEVYTPTEWSKEPVRHCEEVPTIDTFIGKENTEKLKEVIGWYRDTYRWGLHDINTFNWGVFSAPNSNRETVVKAWKEIFGKDIVIPEDNEWKDIYKEDEEALENNKEDN